VPLNLKLTHQGFFLISVPLLFELILLGTLSWMLAQAEDKTKAAERSRAIMWEISTLENIFYSAASCLVAYNVTKQDLFAKRFESTALEIPEHLRILSSLSDSSPQRQQALKRIELLANRALHVMEEVQILIKQKKSLSEVGILSYTAEFGHGVDELTAELERVLKIEQASAEKNSPEESERLIDILKRLILTGVLLSIALAVALAAYFNLGTVKRLRVLLDNTVRLAKRDPLNSPITGTDELAHLDDSFHKMSAALAEAIRKEQAAIENAQDVICSVDEDGIFLTLNPACLNVFGYTPDELIGKHYFRLLAPEDQRYAETEFHPLLEGIARPPFECRVERKDGQLIDALWSARWSHEQKALFCVAHNVTERKELERLKQQFMNMITHDLRSPLTSIRCSMAMLSEGICGELPDSAHQKIVTVERSVDWLIDLISDLLDIDKLEAGKMELKLDHLPVTSIIDRAVSAVEDYAQAHQVKLKRAPTDAELYADADRLVQVLVNLITNAVKFSPQGSSVVVSALSLSEAVELKVSDQGRGIPASYKERIFERFEQVKVTDSTQKGGTGLGLAICKAIVDAHGGTIGVESEEGKGTTIWFRIPSNARQAIDAAQN
jgi:PAS domain S-box-containing protein